jgi:hypothetical protein
VNGVSTTVPFVQAGTFVAGDRRNLTLEYYVIDHLTVPSPEYQLLVDARTSFSVPSAATPLNLTTNRYVNGTYIIQWPSRRGYNYYIHYAPTLDDLVNDTDNSRIVNPPVPGTGFAVQWIDNGPPKTVSPPVDGSRFYRVLELPSE